MPDTTQKSMQKKQNKGGNGFACLGERVKEAILTSDKHIWASRTRGAKASA
jgi:hypothetical protein